MDTLNPNQMPPMQVEVDNGKSKGPLIAVIVILALIIVGGLYFLKERASQEVYVPEVQEDGDNITASLEQQSDSDDLNSIEADLNANDFDNLDDGATVIQAGIQ